MKLDRPGVVIPAFIFVAALIPCLFLFALGLFRFIVAEGRYVPSSSMEPALNPGDTILVEKLSGHLGKPLERGTIIVFYPPPCELPGGKDLSMDPLTMLGRWTGLPFLPYEPAFIKRVIATPGDKIRIDHDSGVFINEHMLKEPYVKEPAAYDLNSLGDIGGRTPNGMFQPFAGDKSSIVVPPGQLFVLGDKRNYSEDSHIWGFLDEKRVIGRVMSTPYLIAPSAR